MDGAGVVQDQHSRVGWTCLECSKSHPDDDSHIAIRCPICGTEGLGHPDSNQRNVCRDCVLQVLEDLPQDRELDEALDEWIDEALSS